MKDSARPASPGQQPPVPSPEELIHLYNRGRHRLLLGLARAHPDHELLSLLAPAIHFSRQDPKQAAQDALAIKDDQQRMLRLKTAQLWPELHAPLKDEPRVHLLILCHNREQELWASFEQLAATNYTNYEVFVADNGSSDGTWERAREAVRLFPEHVKVHLERFPTNIGRPAGHNWLLTGFDHSRADYIAIGDDDLVDVPPDWLSRMIRTARCFPKCAVVGGKALNPGKPNIVHGGVRNIQKFTETELVMSNDEDMLDVGQFDYVDKVDHVIGCLHIYDRRVLDEVGLFDIRFSPCQFVDIEHHLRTRMAGYEVIFNGLIAFRHLRAMGNKARGNAALAGNSEGNILKLLRMNNPEQVTQRLVKLREKRWNWLCNT